MGGQCYSLFDCSGSNNCCFGIGAQGENYCYPVCDKGSGQKCSEVEKCQKDFHCCNGVCAVSCSF